ncbi:cytochrome P450 [Cristinia sonorae]|uniref:Cytochrome P450 n=1 Tax=Cristinia sonorae TaxID=1940300 RepID=A0A8K0XSB2_9AGAR|nr:cytochrome P450 [Cristinia sonorae]
MGILTLGLICIILGLCLARYSRRTKHPLPPGPKPWPLIGNVLDMPTIRPWEKYAEWCKEYRSDLVFLQLPMQPVIIVGSFTACIDLFEKRSQLYSDRISSVLFNMMGCDYHFSIMRYTPWWRAHRRKFHQHFHSTVVPMYQPVQLQQTRMFLSWIVKSPENSRKLIRQLITAVIFKITYGKQITSMDDEYVTLAQIGVEGIGEACIPGAYFVDLLPILRYIPSWVPGTAAKKLAEKYRPYVMGTRDKPYDEVKKAVENGTASPSWAATLVEEIRTNFGNTEAEEFNELIARNVAGVAYAAGADTTSSSSLSLLLAMAMFPEVQKKAQAELDRVVGPDRLPDFEDVERIPYIKAIVMETLRWMPVAPFAIPHAVLTDDVYEGYHIPKGSLLIPNVWAMFRNPDDYPEPEQFKPERFIGKDGNINPDVLDPINVAFGFGRRQVSSLILLRYFVPVLVYCALFRLCPGRHLAVNTLCIYAASTLYAFDITPGVDADGNPVVLSNEQLGALITMPRTVPCGLTPRTETTVCLIQEAVAEYDYVSESPE